MNWKDLPERKNCFTVRNASMIDLKNKKAIRAYSANTRINVVQKCVTKAGTFYRTESAKEAGLDWAFRASAFGLPDEQAPSAPSMPPISKSAPTPRTQQSEKKQKSVQKQVLPNDGEAKPKKSWLSKLLRRKNG